MDYDHAYSTTENYFGTEPEAILVEHWRRLDRSRPVLDIGCGQGRNSLYLARQALEVHALDPCSLAIAQVRAAAHREGLRVREETSPWNSGATVPQIRLARLSETGGVALPTLRVSRLRASRRCGAGLMRKRGVVSSRTLGVHTIEGGFSDLETGERTYGGVLLFGILQEADRTTINALTRAITEWTAPGGLLWITAFTTDDPAHTIQSQSWQEIGPGSYRSPDGEVRTYLEHGELRELFPAFEPIHLWEGLGPEHRHGDGPPGAPRQGRGGDEEGRRSVTRRLG